MREALCECLAKNTTQWPQPEPRLLNPETSALTTKPPCQTNLNLSLLPKSINFKIINSLLLNIKKVTCTYSKKKTFPLLSYSFCQPGGSSKKITENIYCGLNLICQQNFQSNIHLSQSEMKGNYGNEIGLKN